MFVSSEKYSKNRQKGNIGESLACLFLMKQGFKILNRNYLRAWGEIDIVAERADKLHFVEVKSVSCEIKDDLVSRETMRPEENMTDLKLQKLKRAIKTYMIDRKISHETDFQIDLIAIRFDSTSRTAVIEKFDNVEA